MNASRWRSDIPIEKIAARAYTIPADETGEGTLSSDNTTILIVRVWAGEHVGLGYTYTDKSALPLVHEALAPHLLQQSALETSLAWDTMRRVTRKLAGRSLVAHAISALDNALWDLKAKLLNLALCDLLGRVRREVCVYGSGGFSSDDQTGLEARLLEWTTLGIECVKMNVGSDPRKDAERVKEVRQVIGPEMELFVDANGCYGRKQALVLAEHFADQGVTGFEEPVPSSDHSGRRFLVDHVPSKMNVITGEHGHDLAYFRDLIAARGVDILQADVTRCLGVTGFLKVASLCEAHSLPLSTAAAPALHLPLGVSLSNIVHLEYFHDHVRIERQLFEGSRTVQGGSLAPDRAALGFGLSFKEQDAEKFA